MRFIYFILASVLALAPLEASETKEVTSKKKDWKTVTLVVGLFVISVVTIALVCRKNESPSK